MANVRVRGVVLVVLSGLPAAACGDRVVEEEQYPTVPAGFDPVDGTTDHGDGELAVVVADYNDYADDAAMAEVAARTRVTTWPERNPVATDSRIGLAAPPSHNTKLVVLTPTTPLEDRWYVLSTETKDLPRLFRFASEEWSVGFSGTRFRPGSQPRLSRARFCRKDTTVVVYLVLSELASLEPADIVLTQDGQPLACTRPSAGPSRLVRLDCPALNLARPIALSIGGGGIGATGVAFEPGSWAIDLPRLPAADCPTFAVPIE